MRRRRRGLLLAGLSLLLGGLAAADVAGREARLRAQAGPLVPVVVAARELAAGRSITRAALAVRRVPARFAPAGTIADPAAVAGLRPLATVPAGTDVSAGVLADAAASAPVRAGERVAEVLAAGPPDLVHAGGRVDVLVTEDGRGSEAGRTGIALEDAEVLDARPAGEGSDGGGRVRVALRVTLRQAVYLAAAQAHARELRVLPRPDATP
jgi:pilus assembly protein CpaB